MQNYQSRYPNDVHQLNVTVSKHLYVSSDGVVKSQQKPFEISLGKTGQAPRKHLIHYVIRDHFSGAFYAESCTTDRPMPVGDFLHRAWSKKANCLFCGIPELLVVPATVTSFFPQIDGLLSSFGIVKIKATSGFHAGIRDIKTWEENLKWRYGNTSFTNLKFGAPQLSAELNDYRHDNKDTKIKIWRDHLPEGKVSLPPNIDDFLKFYA